MGGPQDEGGTAKTRIALGGAFDGRSRVAPMPPTSANAPQLQTPPPPDVRLDKWLWCVRVYKTRAQATEACRGGKVTLDGQPARPAREVRTGQIVAINLGGWTRTLRVGPLLDKRVAHAVVGTFIEDLTPPEERERGRERQIQNLLGRPHGEGRPTKRERRAFDQAFRGPYDY